MIDNNNEYENDEMLDPDEILNLDEEVIEGDVEEEVIEESEYWGDLEGEDLADKCFERVETISSALESNGYYDRWRQLWEAYYMASFEDGFNGTYGFGFAGQQSEFLYLQANEFKSILKTKISMVSQDRPDFDIRSTNTDAKSNQLSSLIDNIVDYYYDKLKIDKYLNKALEQSQLFDAGYLMVEFDIDEGEDYTVDPESPEESPQILKEGDVTIYNPTAFDVFFDPKKEDWYKHDWVIVRQWVSRSDLMTRYKSDPEIYDAIAAADSDGTSLTSQIHLRNHITLNDDDLNDDIPLYKFFHKKTRTMEQGRALFFIEGGIVISDTPLPYKEIPLYRVVEDEQQGVGFGYSGANTLLPLQLTLDILNSTILSNQNAFGTQMIAVPEGARFDTSDLTGFTMLTYDPATEKPPQGINLTHTPAEIFKYKQEIEQEMMRISGIGDISRGQPMGAASGSALALQASMAAQNQSMLQQNYSSFAGEVVTAIIQILRTFIPNERTITIAGKHTNAKYYFTKDDLEDFDRVVAELGNPLTRTFAGRLSVAQELVSNGLATPDQYLEVLNTGNLDNLTEDSRDEMGYVRQENEWLMEGNPPNPHPTDNHELHISVHRKLLQKPSLRRPTDQTEEDMAVLEAVQNHILAHMEIMNPQQQTEPGMGQQSVESVEAQQAANIPTAEDTAAVAETNPGVDAAAAAGTTLPRMPREKLTGTIVS